VFEYPVDPSPPTPTDITYRHCIAAGRRYAMRRRTLTMAGVAAAVALGVSTVALTAAGTPGPEIRVATPPPTTSVPQPAEAATETVTTAPPSTTLPPTTGQPTPSTTADTTTTTATTVAAKVEQCDASDWQVTAAATKSRYAPGEQVEVRVTARNISARTCSTPPGNRGVKVYDAENRLVFHNEGEPLAAGSGNGGDTGVPPEGLRGAILLWDQQGCARGADPCEFGPMPPGSYRLEPIWSLPMAAATVQIGP
jgi:hypothetical protein